MKRRMMAWLVATAAVGGVAGAWLWLNLSAPGWESLLGKLGNAEEWALLDGKGPEGTFYFSSSDPSGGTEDYNRFAGQASSPAGMSVGRISLMLSTRGKHGMIYTEIGSVEAVPPEE